MPPRTYVSPRDLAAAIDASESSLKRWADEGLLEVHRTSGGHRRIPIAEAIRFVRQSRLSVVNPEKLGLPDVVPATGAAASAVRLEELYRDHRDRDVSGHLLRAFLDGSTVAELCDGPMRSSLAAIGDLYEHDPEGIAVEHAAVDGCLQGLLAIRQLLNAPTDAPVAVGGAVERDPYALPSLSVSVVLAECGYRSINAGPNMPLGPLVAMVRRTSASLLWRSCSIELSRPQMDAELAALEEVQKDGCEVVLGGRVSDRLARRSPEMKVFGSLQELAGLARARLGSESA